MRVSRREIREFLEILSGGCVWGTADVLGYRSRDHSAGSPASFCDQMNTAKDSQPLSDS